MVDLPIAWQERVTNVDFSIISGFVADFMPFIDIVRDTWDRETLTALSEGKIFVSDALLNEMLAQRLTKEENSPLKKITVNSSADGTFSVNALLPKNKTLVLQGIVESFVKEPGKAQIVYRIQKHKMSGDNSLTAFVFKNLSLSTAQKLFGDLRSAKKDLPVTVKHNTVTVDFADVLAASRLAGATLPNGKKLLDLVEIEGASVKKGGIEIDTKFVGGEHLKDMLTRAIAK